jgi:hypothetical protein
MGHRLSVSSMKRKPFKSPPSPNSTVDVISADIRIFFPPNADYISILKVLEEAYWDIRLQTLRKYFADA